MLSAPTIAASTPVALVCAELMVMGLVLATARAAQPTRPAELKLGALVAAFIACVAVLELTLTPWLIVLLTTCLLFVGSQLGGYLGSLLKSPPILTVTAYAAALGDVFSVAHPHGITAHALKHPRVLHFVALSVPVLGTTRMVPLVGVGDVVFASMFMVGAQQAGLSRARTCFALSVALILTVLSTETLELSLPAIPFMSAAVILAHKQTWRLPEGQERRIMRKLVGLTVLLGLLLIVAKRA